MTDSDVAFASIETIAALFRKRKLSPVELTNLMLARIDQLNPKLNAYITVTAELALAQAKKAEAELFAPRGTRRDRGPLHGIPISLKDNIHTAGVRTTAGSQILKNFVPDRDAAVWAKLKEAGAILLGKTNMHEFAYGVTSNNPHFGAVHNPWDLTRIPGGSSGGSAVAVAAGLGYASIGTDTGGSIRIPATLCGVVGFKPMRGQINEDGVIPLSSTLDCTGPIAGSVTDAAIVFHHAGLPGLLRQGPWSTNKIFRPIRKFTLGLPQEFFFDVLSPEIRALFDDVLSQIKKRGAQIKSISIPLLNETEEVGNQIAWAEATHYHQHSDFFPARATEYGEDVRMRLEMGTKVSAPDYLNALNRRVRFIQQLAARMAEAKVDALVVPTTPIEAPLIGQEKTIIRNEGHPTRALLLRPNRPANLANAPAVSIPCGFTNSGLPVGLQLIGQHSGQLKLLNIAQAITRILRFERRPPL
jgi:aspartyl-tRNA(Asn)/glutamyl-tRNA(Gln) amidotransferase subunit A